jgi:hypothetical protein
MKPAASTVYRNTILASMSVADIERLGPHLSLVDLPRNQTLQEPGKPVETVYFLEQGICSIVATMVTGATVEVGIIGHEGFVGLPAVLGTGQSPNRCFMQIPGHGYRVKSKGAVSGFCHAADGLVALRAEAAGANCPDRGMQSGACSA